MMAAVDDYQLQPGVSDREGMTTGDKKTSGKKSDSQYLVKLETKICVHPVVT